jgi:hypothetical protein
MSDEKTDFMNKTLYTLTLITALATPLMFLTGLFGMNFADMEELVRALKGGISYRETGGVLHWK